MSKFSFGELLDQLRRRKAERIAAVARGARELVIALADGESVPPDEVEAMLDAHGETEDWLKAEVEIEIERRRLRTVIAGKDAVALDAEQLDHDQAAVDAEHTKNVERWRKARGEIAQRRGANESLPRHD